MTTYKPSHLVPKLRFPKFEGAGDWEEKQLSSLVKLVSGVHLAPDMYSTTGEVPYFTGPSDFTDAIQCVAKWTDESVNIAKQHDTLITVKGSGVGKIWYLTLPSIAMGRQLMAVRTEVGDRRFIYQFLSTRRAQFEALASGNLIPGLSRDDILGMAAYFPSRDEQQKISDCLGSLDDLIAAEGRKLEALRQHKQGLMQQLFPRPGETVPKLRFPEFRVDTTWLAPQLADLYGFKRTNTLSRDNLNYEFGTIRNIHYGDIHTKFKPLFRLENEHVPYVNLDVAPDGFDDEAFCEEGDIVLADASEDLDGVGKAIEVVSLNGERVVAGTHTILATRRGSVPVVGFGGQLFQSTAVRTGIKREAQGAKVYGISANRISAIPVPVPPTKAEQQKIADCLGSLDDLIAAEGRKLEALRQHKQGLMQQLFPSLEG